MKLLNQPMSVFLLFSIAAVAVAGSTESPSNLPVHRDHEMARDLANEAELATFMDAMMETYLSAAHVPGATVSIVKDGQMIFSKGYGFADVENQIPVDPKTSLFRIASISKIFTATAILQLVEQGKLDLDTDIDNYLTDFKVSKKFPEPITIRHLFTHTAGFEDTTFGKGLVYDEARALPVLEVIKDYFPEQVRAPGSVPAYSNYSTTLLGRLVEVASGLNYHDYIEANILQPLGMTHTTSRQPLPEALAPDMTAGYYRGKGPFTATEFLTFAPAPAGSFSSTAEDMSRFMIAHLQNGYFQGQRILKEESSRVMKERQYAPDPRLSAMLMQFFERFINGERIVEHSGGLILHNSEMMLIPEHNIGFFVSFNGGNSNPFLVAEEFLDYYFPYEKTLQKLADSNTRVPRVVGSYIGTRRNYTSAAKVGSFLSGTSNQITDLGDGVIGSGGKRYLEVEPYVFEEINGPGKLIFNVDSSGQVTHYAAQNMAAGINERLTGMQKIAMSRWVTGTIFVILVWASLGWLYGEARRFWVDSTATSLEKNAWRVAAVPGALAVLLYFSLQSDFLTLYMNYPFSLKLALNLNYLYAIATVVMVILAVKSWRGDASGTWFRLRYTGVTVAAVLGFGWLSYWNLIGA